MNFFSHLFKLVPPVFLYVISNKDPFILLCIIVSSIALIYFLSRFELFPDFSAIKFIPLFHYFCWLFKEIVNSSFRLSVLAWRSNMHICGKIQEIRYDKEQELFEVLLANSITLTPGTVTIDHSKGKLLVQAIHQDLLKDMNFGKMVPLIKLIFLK